MGKIYVTLLVLAYAELGWVLRPKERASDMTCRVLDRLHAVVSCQIVGLLISIRLIKYEFSICNIPILRLWVMREKCPSL